MHHIAVGRRSVEYLRNNSVAELGRQVSHVQIFVISNGTNTKYYSNTTRFNAVKEAGKSSKKTKTSTSFEFTSFWADANNKIIPDLVDFTKTFFAKHTIETFIAGILCVLFVEKCVKLQ